MRAKLRKINVFPTEVNEGGAGGSTTATSGGGFTLKKFFSKPKVSDIANMTRQLSTLINANIPLVDALSALVEQIEQPVLKSALSEIREKVREGVRLADAMRSYPHIFGDLYLNMVHAGEISGALDTVLARLADFTEGQARLTSKVKGALTYPLVMGVVGVTLMSFLLVFVVPKIAKIFEDAKATLPLPTRVLLGISGFLQHYWYVALIVVAAAFYAFKKFKAKPNGRRFLDKMSLRMPIFGDMFRMIAVSRFCRTLATLMGAGVQLMPSLDIVKGVVDNVILTEVIEETRNSVKEGESIAEPLKRSGQFPPLVTHMIGIGEKTGELEVMLEKVANTYDDQVETKVSTLTTLLEPLMIVVMGGVVAAIVLSILLPILKMNQMVK
ncbi:MAG: type II secretion system inner membrane protein GspF [Deltaproteobacteria bacterium]|nr:type II secretion system inner membrane protein GspF [Deltaproteobacteria bacterium]